MSCRNHGVKVIIDLHAAEGSQNGNDHSASRDGYTEWGESYIPNTVHVIDFLAERFLLYFLALSTLILIQSNKIDL